MILPSFYNKYENKRLCKKCKGKCCDNSPCLLDVKDIDTSSSKAIAGEILSKGYTIVPALDSNFYYSNQYFTFPYLYVRSASVYNKPVDLLDLNGPCKHKDDKGCDFSFSERPSGGKLLIPEKGGKCHYEHDFVTYNLVLSFMPFQEDLKEACEIITGSKVEDDINSIFTRLSDNSFECDDYILSGIARGFVSSYLYVDLANTYGLYKYSPEAIRRLNNLLLKYPDKKDEILEYVKKNYHSKSVEIIDLDDMVKLHL